MLNIYICEDTEKQLAMIQKYIYETITLYELDMQVVCASSSPYKLLDNLKENEGSGVYFLDVDLSSDINGIQLASEIRKCDPRGFIVFITTHAEMSFLTFKYKVEALDYIIKDDFDLVADRIKDCLLNIQDKFVDVSNSLQKFFHIETKDKIIHVDYQKILFFETSHKSHKLILHAVDRKVEFYSNMSQIEKLLDERFVRCHRSFLINTEKIAEIDKKNKMVVFQNGQTCEVSSRKMKLFRKNINIKVDYPKEG